MMKSTGTKAEPTSKENRLRVPIDKIVILALIVFLILLVIGPIAKLAYGAFSTVNPGEPGGTFTLGNVAQLARQFPLFLNTVEFSILGALISTGLGLFMAWAVARTEIPLRTFIGLLVVIPLFFSSLTLAIAWVTIGDGRIGLINILARSVGLPTLFNLDTYWGMIFVLAVTLTPFAYLLLVGPMQSIGGHVEEASSICGASTRRTFYSITLRLLVPSILSAFFLNVIFGAQVYSIPQIMGANFNYQNFATAVVQFAQQGGNFRLASAESLLLVGFSVLILYFYIRVTSRSERFATIGSTAGQTKPVSLGKWKYAVFAFCIAFVVISSVLPFLSIVVESFFKYSTTSFSPSLLTTGNFAIIFQDSLIFRSITNTILFAIAIPVIAVMVSLVVSFVVLRMKWRGSKVLDMISSLPIAYPGQTLALGLIWFYVTVPLVYDSVWIMIIGYLTLAIPLALRFGSGAFVQMRADLEEASYVCGNSVLGTIRRITAPSLKPTLLVLFVYVFLWVFRQFELPLLLYTPSTSVITVEMWSYTYTGEYQLANALSLIQTLIILATMFVASKFLGVGLSDLMSGVTGARRSKV